MKKKIYWVILAKNLIIKLLWMSKNIWNGTVYHLRCKLKDLKIGVHRKDLQNLQNFKTVTAWECLKITPEKYMWIVIPYMLNVLLLKNFLKMYLRKNTFCVFNTYFLLHYNLFLQNSGFCLTQTLDITHSLSSFETTHCYVILYTVLSNRYWWIILLFSKELNIWFTAIFIWEMSHWTVCPWAVHRPLPSSHHVWIEIRETWMFGQNQPVIGSSRQRKYGKKEFGTCMYVTQDLCVTWNLCV